MKKLTWIDFVILVVIIAALGLGVATYKKLRQTAGKQVVATEQIVFQVFLRSVTLTTNGENPIKAGDTTFITIRNVPHKKVTILATKMFPRMQWIALPDGNVRAVEDLSTPSLFDGQVVLVDDAKITDDGAVLGGNKLKIGLPIILEGKNYRFNGTVSSIQVLSAEEAKQVKDTIQKAKEEQAKADSENFGKMINPADVLNGVN